MDDCHWPACQVGGGNQDCETECNERDRIKRGRVTIEPNLKAKGVVVFRPKDGKPKITDMPLKCSACGGNNIESDTDILRKVFEGRAAKMFLCYDCEFSWEEPVGSKMGMRERAKALVFLAIGKGKNDGR